MYLATFPKNWTETFDGSKDIDNTRYEEIDCFMEKQKEKSGQKYSKKEKEKKKKEEEKKKAQSSDSGRRGSKYKIDPKKNHRPQAQCKKCLNAKHNWSQCFLNPANPNNKLGDPEFMRKVQGNRNSNFGNNQQPRQAFYGNGQPYPLPLPPSSTKRRICEWSTQCGTDPIQLHSIGRPIKNVKQFWLFCLSS